MDTRHNYENQIAELCKNKTPRFVITNARDVNYNDPRILFNDYLFNRTKAYYSDYVFSGNARWLHRTHKEYTVPVDDVALKNKIYIAPNRTYTVNDEPQQRIYRKQLMSLLKQQYRDLGHLGDPADPEIGHLPSNCSRVFGGYAPPHNRYFESTFISIYTETIEFGTTFVATEKTFDPLIKGHLILPFCNSKFIGNLKHYYGFEFPDFIDYSYDDIEDTQQRYHAYQEEVKRLLTFTLDQWQQHWISTKVLRMHNQQVFADRPYHRTDLTDIG